MSNKKKFESVVVMDDYVENILAENLTLKRKLDSKCEAISILNLEVEKLKMEIERKDEIITELKGKMLRAQCEPATVNASADCTRGLKIEIDCLRQKLRDALGDVQALRIQLENGKPQGHASEDASGISNQEIMVEQIETLLKSKLQLESDLQAMFDEKEELSNERDAYKCKLHRLNHECNVILKGNTNGLIDIDALIMENRFLQERLLHSQEECQLAKKVSDRYKNLLKNKKLDKDVGGGGVNKDQMTCDADLAVALTRKQVMEYLSKSSLAGGTAAETAELRSVCVALLDGLSDKSLALCHQKRANRILAATIAEMQSQLNPAAISSSYPHQQQLSFSPSGALLEGYNHHKEL